MIRRKDSNNKKESKNTKKYNFKGKSARSIRWFDLDHKCLEENLVTREPNFYEKFNKIILGVMMKNHINYLQCQLVIKK